MAFYAFLVDVAHMKNVSLGPWESIGIDKSIIRHVNDILRQENVIFIDFVKTILR